MSSMRLVVVSAAFAAAGLAQADVTATFNSVDPGAYSGSYSINGGATTGSTGTAGLFRWTQTGGSDIVGIPDFAGFCIELTENVGFGGSYNYDVVALATGPSSVPMGAFKADALSELIAVNYALAFDTDPVGISATQASALQLAVWEIVYENGGSYDLASGTASFSDDGGAAWDLANTYLAALGTSSLRNNDLFVLSRAGIQDMLVPAPGTAVLAGAGMIMIRRRRR